MNVHPKIIESIDTMISDAILSLQYYGEFCQFINFKELKSIATCGVSVDIHGMRFFYNNDFIEDLSQEEMNFIMLHEIYHLLWDHSLRTKRCGYEHELSNVAQDMIINNVIKTDIVDKMKYYNKKYNKNVIFAKSPVDKKTNKIWVLEMPVEYKGALIFEELYEWLFDERKKYKDWKDECKNEKGDKNCPVSDYLKRIFDQLDMGILDFLDDHLPDDISPEHRKSILENVKEYLKNRGLLTNDIRATLNKLNKSKKDHIKNIKIGINELFGYNKNKSISRRNRRSIPGVKGKRKNSFALNVIFDVSGSMEGYFEKSLSYIFQNDIVINLVQCDTEVKSHTVVKSKSDFKKIEISGLGGTSLQPGVDYVANNKKLNKFNTLILTDGYCEKYLSTKALNKVLLISLGKKVEMDSNAKNIVIKD